MATHSSVLAWEIPWTEEPGGIQSVGSQESDTTERLNHFLAIHLSLCPLLIPSPLIARQIDFKVNMR